MSAIYTVQEYVVSQQRKATTQASGTVDDTGYVSQFVIYRTRVNVVVTAVDRVVTALTKRLLSTSGSVLSQYVIPTTIVQSITTNYVETSYYMPDQTVFMGIAKAGTRLPTPI
jgi:surface polysaccharide O-acyltransferase-like enzyme